MQLDEKKHQNTKKIFKHIDFTLVERDCSLLNLVLFYYKNIFQFKKWFYDYENLTIS